MRVYKKPQNGSFRNDFELWILSKHLCVLEFNQKYKKDDCQPIMHKLFQFYF